MARSFVRQGVNIICTNMTVSTPRKLGLDPKKASIPGAGITIYSAIPEPLLNILDKKLNDCFKCKMPLKVWGGLAMFFAGIAVVAIVVVVVATAPVSLSIAAGVTAATVATATTIGTATIVGMELAAGYTLYKTLHECDRIQQSQWQDYHESVRIEKENALLDSAWMKCPVGGRLEIIIDDAIAQKAATIISSANNNEVYLHWGSKFINGTLAFLGGQFGVAIASALEIYNTAMDDGVSNKSFDLSDEIKNTAQDTGVSLEADVLNALLKHKVANGHGGTTVFALLLYVQSKGLLSPNQANAILARLAGYGKVLDWKEFGKDALKGLAWTAIGTAVDQYSNYYEKEYEKDAYKKNTKINEEDKINLKNSKNSIGIYSIEDNA